MPLTPVAPPDLGALCARERPRSVVRAVALATSGLVLSFVAAVLAGMAYAVAENHRNAWATDTRSLVTADVFFLVCGALVAALGVGQVRAFARWWPSPTVSLFERGLVCERGAQRTVISWDSVDRVVFRAVRITFVSLFGDKTGEWYRMTVGAGAQSVVLTESISITIEVLAIARRRVVDNCLPASLERLQKGETLTFGRERISPDHVRIGGKTIPWARIHSVEMRDGLVIVTHSARRRARASQWVRSIPNVDVFLALCNARRSSTGMSVTGGVC